jgi:glycerophosphoryl diester phosphodiesterase
MRCCVLLLLALPLTAETLVLGHRGCRALRPENTIAAFEHALAVGADVLELDVVVTQDNQLVVHHDLELNGRPVHTLTLAEVRAFDRGATPSPNFPRQELIPGERNPTLAEVLTLARKRQARLMIETKVDPAIDPAWFAATLHQQLMQHGVAPQVILQSFDHRTLHAMRQLAPRMPLVLLNPRQKLADYISPARALGPPAIQMVNVTVIDADIVRTLKAAGIPIYSGTTDEPAQWKRLIALGVDGILTDDPAGLRRLLPR